MQRFIGRVIGAAGAVGAVGYVYAHVKPGDAALTASKIEVPDNTSLL